MLADRIVKETQYRWVHEEHDRVAHAVMTILHRNMLTSDELERWLKPVAATAAQQPLMHETLPEWPTPNVFNARSVLHVRRPLLLVYVVAVVALVLACVGGASEMLVPVLVYGACLGTMAVLSTGVNRVTAAGGALFLVSDGLIALEAFVPGFDLPAQGFWVMTTYLAAQALIVAGVLLEDAGAKPTPTHPDAVRSI